MARALGRLLPSRLKRRLKSWLHAGRTYVCPICGYSARDLFPIGLDLPVLADLQIVGGGLRLGGCYRCESTDRERLVYLYLREKSTLREHRNEQRVLHIAPEHNLMTFLSGCGLAEYVCGDKLIGGNEYPTFVQNMDLTRLTFPDEYFDLIICNHVLEHIPDDMTAIRELFRVLTVGGHAILQVPISRTSQTTREDPSVTEPAERERLYGQVDHVRVYGQDYPMRLARCGFTVTRQNLAREFPRAGLNPEEDLFVGRKERKATHSAG